MWISVSIVPPINYYVVSYIGWFDDSLNKLKLYYKNHGDFVPLRSVGFQSMITYELLG